MTDAVSLYRLAGRPEWIGRQFGGELDFMESSELLARLRAGGARGARFDELTVDGELVLDGDELPVQGERTTFTFHTSTQDGQRFFRNAGALADEHRPLGRGEFPDQFYLVEEDYYHDGNEDPPGHVRNLIALTKFVKMLANLSDHRYETEGSGAWTLAFRTRDGLGVLETRFSREVLDLEVPPLPWKIVEDLSTDMDGVHSDEKRWMFKAGMCEILKADLSFKEFIACGAKWATTYESNLQTYLSGFSFEEVKRAIADEHARFAEQVSKILGDITVKVLSLPLSLAIVTLLRAQAKNFADWPLVILLLVVVAAGVTWLVRHYQRVVPRVEENIEMVFGRMERMNSPSQAKEIESSVKEVVQSLKRETTKLRTTLRIYLFGAWLVPTVAVAMLVC